MSSDRADPMDRSLEDCLAGVGREVRAILERCLSGQDLTVPEAITLCSVTGRDLQALALTADHLRREQVGDVVTYVVNRNINFTNVCTKACRFCAFARTQRSTEGYFLDIEEVVRRAVEARTLGATEVCLQAGLAPGLDGRFYIDLLRAVKAAAPDLHLHAYSPEEVKYGAGLLGLSIPAYLAELQAAGLNSLPGTSAEILDDAVRARISPGRISTAEWIEVIQSAHRLGLPTTSTLMFGHVESDAERMRHLDLLRTLQRQGQDKGHGQGFTEFVPLSFVHEEAPLFRKQVAGAQPGPGGSDIVRLYAIARLFLGRDIPNLQVSWVKEGLRLGEWLLAAGANDLGGTLINESISTAAGASHGQLVSPTALRRAIRGAGRIPAQRDTRYRLLRQYGPTPGADEPTTELDEIEDADARFGSYAALTRDERFRFRLRVSS
jgi:7,8-didemethyl-8-hydroxy-5-deazariboflavin synthase CofH subunit